MMGSWLEVYDFNLYSVRLYNGGTRRTFPLNHTHAHMLDHGYMIYCYYTAAPA